MSKTTDASHTSAKNRDPKMSMVNWPQYSIVLPNNVNKIIIISKSRSGSTFMADLLQQSWPTFYSHEPLIAMYGQNGSKSNWVNLLTNILDCNFSHIPELFEPNLRKVRHFIWNRVMRQLVEPHNSIELLNMTFNEFVCQRCANRLIKTVVLSVEDYLILKQKCKTQIKLVYLVRDPRGVMSSRYPMQWCHKSANCMNVDALCQHMRQDMAAFLLINKLSKDDIVFVRYEDMSLEPIKTAKRLYERLGLEYTLDVDNWVVKHTQTVDPLANNYTTIRNSSIAPLVWIPRMTVNSVLKIQELCYDVMHNLGYKLITDLVFQANDSQALNNYTLHQILDYKYPLLDLIS